MRTFGEKRDRASIPVRHLHRCQRGTGAAVCERRRASRGVVCALLPLEEHESVAVGVENHEFLVAPQFDRFV
jgi:hypothetical protein